MAYDKVKLGVSLYSYADSYSSYRLDIEGCQKEAARVGYKGISIVAAQHCPEYPNISDDWMKNFREQLDKYNLEPVMWEGYLDVGMRQDRDLTEREIMEYTYNDIVFAKKGGFPIMKTQHSISPATFEKMVPFCKEMDMKLAIEMHYPHKLGVPVWDEYIALFKKYDGILGMVPDYSVWQCFPHYLHIKQGIEEGFRQERLDEVLPLIKERKSEEEVLSVSGLSDVEKKYIEEWYHKNGEPAPVKDMAELLKYSPTIHGKFYYVGDDLQDPCIPQKEIVDEIKASGYEGYVLAEYEGHHFDITVDDLKQMENFYNMYSGLLANA
jgi:sugar phosphate isomerase/epimerase